MLKREWHVESSGKLLHLFIPSKTAASVPVFAVEDLPLDSTATLVPAFAVKDLQLLLLLLSNLNKNYVTALFIVFLL